MRPAIRLLGLVSAALAAPALLLAQQIIPVQFNSSTNALYRPTAANFASANGLLTTAAAALAYQPLNASLTAIAAGTWTGASSITTLGTVTTGTWNAGAVTVPTGNITVSTGDFAASATGKGVTFHGGASITGASGALTLTSSAGQALKIDTSGRIVIGTGSILQGDKLEIQDTGAAAALSFWRFSNDNGSGNITFRKSRGATVGTHGLVADGDAIGNITFNGSDGTNWLEFAQIVAAVDGTPGTNDAPGRLIFNVTPDGSTTLAEAFRISNNKSATFAGSITFGGGSTIKTVLTATATLDFAEIAAAGSADLTITVTGAAVNDSVSLSLPASPTAGIVWNAFVSATNTVTVRASNITASPVNPASATYRATVISF